MAEEYKKNKTLLENATFELNARQISEECGISIEDAKTRLKDKSVEQIKEDLEKERISEEKRLEDEASEKLKGSVLKSVSESEEPKFKPHNVKFISEYAKEEENIYESKEEDKKQKPFNVKFK